jgi:hypothetical protein
VREELRMARTFYLVKRGPRSPLHKAPWHPIIVCGKVKVAKWEAADTNEKAWVWSGDGEGGWLLERWNGLDICYGGLVKTINLPDGSKAGFFHDRDKEPWTLLKGAIWWDDKPLPKMLAELGVIETPDDFSKETIRRDIEFCKTYNP